MAVPSQESNSDHQIKKLVSCNMEMSMIEAEVKALEEGLIRKEVFDHLMSLKSKVPVAERYTTLLKHVHETLQKRLNISATLDAQVTAREAVDKGLIDKNILVHIASLNQNVPGSLKARYLLQFLQPALQRQLDQFRSRIMGTWVVLTNYKTVWLKLSKYLMDELINESVLTALFPEQEDKEICQWNEVAKLFQKERDRLSQHLTTKDKITSPCVREAKTILGLQHLSQLHELLVGYSYKWKAIGVALNFQPQDLQTIEATPLLIPGAPKSYLLRLLQDWLQMTLRHTLPPTVENLKNALNSQTVNLGALGSELQAIDSNSTQSLADSTPNRSYSSTTVSLDGKISFFPPQNDIHIDEGESTLLEVQATGENKKTLVYRWKRRTKTLDSWPIFCLHEADIAWDGTISCEIIANSTRLFSTDSVPVTVHVSCPLDEFTPSLASMYLSKPEVPEDTWPPTGSTKFINLAIIRQWKINYGSEYARLTIRGDIDDELKDKEAIDYDEIYDSLKRERQVMFIEGRPGSGKTTFVNKVTQDWASNSSGGIRVLLLVSLRVLNTFCNPTLSDILHLFRDLKVTSEIIEKRDGKGVCFIFDGLDEFSPSDGKNSIIHKIIDRSYLHQSTVVVASRPAALARLRRKADRIIEVIGFLGNQIQQYFDHYPFSDATKPAKLKAYLSLHPNVLRMCYLPIHASMVAFLFEVTGQVPKTETKTYELFTHLTLMRSISKNKELEPIPEENIFLLLNEEEKLYFKQICQLALDKTLLNKQVLHQEEISFHFKVSKKDISLGLITIDRTAGLYGFKDIYTFLHLTFQEYLAAYHISTLSDEEQMKLIEEHGHKNHMLVVWKFFCGLADFENKFNTLFHKTQGKTLYHFQCAYESQQEMVCAQLLKAVHYDIELANEFLSTPDFTAIGYITNKTIQPTRLSLTDCVADNAAIDALLSEMADASQNSLESLHIKARDITPELIKKLLANFQCLKSLSFEKQEPSSSLNQQVLTQCEEFSVCRKLQTLTLKGFGETYGAFKMMVLALRQCKNLTELNITHNKMGIIGANLLSESLPHCRSLQKINISKNGMSSAAVLNVLNAVKKHLRMSIKRCEVVCQGEHKAISSVTLMKQLNQFTSLQSMDSIVLDTKHTDVFLQCCEEWKDLRELRVESQPHHMRTTIAIARSLQLFLHNLEKLTLKNSIYSSEETRRLTAGLQKCPFLKILDLSGNLFILENLKCLLSVNFSRLEKLYLDHNQILDNEVILLSSHLQGFPSLQVLSLKQNFFTSSGAQALAANLHHCTKLEMLDLQGNSINDDAAYVIVASLKHCANFQSLSLSHEHCRQFAEKFEKEDQKNRKKVFGCENIQFGRENHYDRKRLISCLTTIFA